METYKVVVASLGYESYDVERKILEPLGAELVLAPKDCLTEEEVIRFGHGAHALMVREVPIGVAVIDALDELKVIVRYGVGVDNIDLERARQKGIYVANVPGYGTEEVSDHAIALLMSCVRNLLVRDRNLRDCLFETDIQDQVYRTTGKTLGIIGYGQIGQAFHRKWRGFLPNKVLVFDPLVPQEKILANQAEAVTLDRLLEESDYVTVHTPLTPDTRHIIDRNRLRKMKRTAIIVNTSRGGVVDEEALIEALREKWILSAGVDVFETEPLGRDHPMLSMDNVVLSGHVGWYSKDALRELQTRAAQEVGRVFSGEKPSCWVNPW
jgi:D-3-phosphoglycerate dehydrogenase / 2-oxoglutarate reductase